MIKLSDQGRKEILNSLSLAQLKKIAKECGYKKYETWGGRPWTKYDFVNTLYKDPKFWRKQSLIKLVKKKSIVSTETKRELERKTKSKCEVCGEQFKSGLKPHIHHIKPIEEGGSNKESNLIVLCPNCHCRAHSKVKKYSSSELRKHIRKRN